MGAIFGKGKKESRITEQDKAVLDLKKQRDQLKQYQQNIKANLERDRELARKLLRDGRKDRAKLLLKKKRFQESQLDKSEKQLDNIDEMCHSITFAQIQVKVLEGLKTGNVALQKLHEVLNIEEIEKIMEETREGVDKQNEIDALLSGTLSPEDLDAVETELEKIMAEENIPVPKDEIVLSPVDSEGLSLPEVPATPLPEIQEKEKPAKNKKNKVLVPAS